MKKKIIYYSDSCLFFQRSYQLLEKRDIPFKKYHFKSQNDWNEVKEKTGRETTVPQVFINDFNIDEFDDLSATDQYWELDEILNQP